MIIGAEDVICDSLYITRVFDKDMGSTRTLQHSILRRYSGIESFPVYLFCSTSHADSYSLARNSSQKIFCIKLQLLETPITTGRQYHGLYKRVGLSASSKKSDEMMSLDECQDTSCFYF